MDERSCGMEAASPLNRNRFGRVNFIQRPFETRGGGNDGQLEKEENGPQTDRIGLRKCISDEKETIMSSRNIRTVAGALLA